MYTNGSFAFVGNNTKQYDVIAKSNPAHMWNVYIKELTSIKEVTEATTILRSVLDPGFMATNIFVGTWYTSNESGDINWVSVTTFFI